MKRLAAAIAAIALIGTAAFAQAPPPAPLYSWTGWYAGVNGGGGGSSKDSFVTGFNDEVETGVTTIGGATISPVGGFGGGQIGYNWQWTPQWVVGLEADIQGGSIKDSATAVVINNDEPGSNPDDGPLIATATNKLNWFGTVRVRAGYTFYDNRVLSYVTGGFAFGGVRDNLTVSEKSSSEPLLFGSVSSDTTKTGWIIGSGIEGFITPTLTFRAETDYMSLGSTTLATGTQPDFENFDAPFGTANLNHKYWFTRLGLNYKFGTW